MKIEDLKYLALEGGGGKGAVYLGAIRAIEDECYKEWLWNNEIEKFNDEKKGRPLPPDGSSILDYYRIENGKRESKIKGIAGASAGAVTAFALALGFNSTQIESVLKYSFEEFLTEEDVGKYRAVGQDISGNVKLYVGDEVQVASSDPSTIWNYETRTTTDGSYTDEDRAKSLTTGKFLALK